MNQIIIFKKKSALTSVQVELQTFTEKLKVNAVAPLPGSVGDDDVSRGINKLKDMVSEPAVGRLGLLNTLE